MSEPLDLDDLDEPPPLDVGTPTAEPTDVPAEWGIVLRDRYWLTCHWRDGGAGVPVLISL